LNKAQTGSFYHWFGDTEQCKTLSNPVSFDRAKEADAGREHEV
jgi:hypothetical protein